MRLAVPIVVSLAIVLADSQLNAEPIKLAADLRAQVEQGETTVFVKLRAPLLPRNASLTQRCDAVAAKQRRVLAAMPSGDIKVEKRFESIAALTVTVNADGLAALAANPDVVKIEPMAKGSGALGQNLPTIRGDFVHRRGLEGLGATVAVLDSGVEVTHPDVAGRIIAQQCFCSPRCCPNEGDVQSGAGAAFTRQPHGIHVTGIVASSGIVSSPGTAPAAKVVSVKVLDEQNRGFLSDWIAGLDWIIMNRPDVEAINMSLVSDVTYSGFCDKPEDPNDVDGFVMSFAEAFATLRARKVLTFAASGNAGESDRISAPACVEDAMAVGAVETNGRMWRGSNLSSAIDVLAPGVAIQSDGINGSLQRMTGTSMATGFATGTAALLVAMNRDLTADQIEDVMKRTGVPVPNRNGTLTFPLLDDLRSVNEVWRETQPLLGGGSRTTDCLAVWNFAAPDATRPRPINGAECRDGDPGCDADGAPGRCGFDFVLCFNEPDGRLPECSSSSPIQAYALGTPNSSGDAVDLANAAAIQSVLPPIPITDRSHCSGAIHFTVPVGSKVIRFAAQSADGRIDDDRLRLTCRAAQ